MVELAQPVNVVEGEKQRPQPFPILQDRRIASGAGGGKSPTDQEGERGEVVDGGARCHQRA